MINSPPSHSRRLKSEQLACDLAVIGGGLSGVCAAVTAARVGLKVVLVQDRPVLGGNSSSEVRLWVLGATSHMGNNNRWAREGGVIDELLVENMYRNPEGNPVLFDALLLETVAREPNIRLLLNTVVHDLDKSGPDTIRSVRAFCSQNSTQYHVAAPLFCDASGDGIVGFLAGAAFRMGAEPRSEFQEQLAPLEGSKELLGHSIYFYSKDTGRPVQFIPPSFALKDISTIPRWRDIKATDFGCRFWWFEWGGRFDTVHDTENIKWELWRVVYGVWNFIKNSGQFPEAASYTLEWVGMIPGKRESRRFEGDYILTQRDIVEQQTHFDAVSYGGWAIDLHPADGVYSAQPGCSQWHTKGVFQIPYRAMYSRNITNLFLAGRIISASHVAFASTRVMATCAHGAQAVGMAASFCKEKGLAPRDLLAPDHMDALQQRLLRTGQFVPGLTLHDRHDLAHFATISASSEFHLCLLPPNGETMRLSASAAMMVPVAPGPMPAIEYLIDVSCPTRLHAELRVSSRPHSHTPDVTLATLQFDLAPGNSQPLRLRFESTIDCPRYAFVCLMANDAVGVHLTDHRLTGLLMVRHRANQAVAKNATQIPPPDSGLHSFEFWTPVRRPGGHNFAMRFDPPLAAFGVGNLKNGVARPTNQPNAWVADPADPHPTIRLSWPTPQSLSRIELCFDNDFDHPMESVLMGHPERVVPFCVRDVVCLDSASVAVNMDTPPLPEVTSRSRLLFRLSDNHHSLRSFSLPEPIVTDSLELRFLVPSPQVPAALFDIRCYA